MPLPRTLCPDPEWVKRRSGDLVERTMLTIRRTFDERDHHPSEAQFASLQLNASVIQAMADGNSWLRRNFYLSSLAPGVGKTTLDIEAIRTLNTMPEYRDVGVLFLIARCEEIQNVAKDIGLGDADYAILVSDRTEDCEVIQGWGNPELGNARVLFTTQAMLSKRLAHGESFEALPAFWFRGAPRQVRIWDEAILPSRPITVSLHQIKHLSQDLAAAGFTEVLKALDEFESILKAAREHGIVQVPDLKTFDIGLEDLRSVFKDEADKQVIEDLWGLSSNCVRVRRNQATNVLVDYEDMFPEDLGPMLVQDASGGLRKTYDLWRKDRGGLCYLLPAPKSFEGLTIHHWDRGAGRSVFKPGNAKGDLIILGVAAVVESIPASEPVLVVHYKEKKYVRNIEKELRTLLGARDNVRFIHWGIHTATNEFQDYKHVILIGAYQYSVPVNEAYGRGAKAIRTHDLLSAQEHNEVRLGEIKHNLYQAACRGNIRKSEGDGCPPGNHLYMIFSTHKATGMPRKLLCEVFPSAIIRDWKPFKEPLNPKAEQLVEILSANGAGGTFRKSDLRGGLQVSAPTLRHLIAGVADTMDHIGQRITVRTRWVVVHPNVRPIASTPTEAKSI